MKKIVIYCALISLIGGIALAQGALQKETLLERIKTTPKITPQQFSKEREEIKKLIEKKQLEIRENIQKKREERKVKIDALKEQLREKIKQKISAKKQEIVERVYERINALNDLITNHYLNVLDRLEKILERIESRTAKAKLNGKDVSQVETAIEKAHQAINSAREAVKAQAEKVYQPPEITGEEKLKLEVGKLRKQLHDDLKAVEKLVKEARDAVRQAAVALAQIPKVDEIEVATPTQPAQ
jgi:DNA repair exonuclease SbcCD ATPase subunit